MKLKKLIFSLVVIGLLGSTGSTAMAGNGPGRLASDAAPIHLTMTEYLSTSSVRIIDIKVEDGSWSRTEGIYSPHASYRLPNMPLFTWGTFSTGVSDDLQKLATSDGLAAMDGTRKGVLCPGSYVRNIYLEAGRVTVSYDVCGSRLPGGESSFAEMVRELDRNTSRK